MLRMHPELVHRGLVAAWAARFERVLRRRPRLRPPTPAERSSLAGQRTDTRQQRRARAFAAAFVAVCDRYGGGLFCKGECEPRRARRRIARRWAKERRP